MTFIVVKGIMPSFIAFAIFFATFVALTVSMPNPAEAGPSHQFEIKDITNTN